MNSESDQKLKQQQPNLGTLFVTPSDPRDEQIAALERELEGLKNKHNEDKFMWLLASIAVFDVAALLRADNWTAPLIIGVIELIAIIVMASRCGVDVVAPLIDKLIGMVPSWKKGGGG